MTGIIQYSNCILKEWNEEKSIREVWKIFQVINNFEVFVESVKIVGNEKDDCRYQQLAAP